MLHLLELPDETLLEILEYFRLEDIKRIRQSCKRLYLLSLDKCITRNEYLLLNERVFKKSGTVVASALAVSVRRFDVLVLKNDNYYMDGMLRADLLLGVIAKFGDGIREVFYHKTNTEFSRSFQTVIECCPNLEHLCIRDCNDLFMHEQFEFGSTRLLKMRSLQIYQTQYLSDLIMSRLCALCPNLQELTLSSCGMNMHNGVYGKYYREEPSESLEPSNDVFNYKYLFYLMSRMRRITELNLSFTNLSYKHVAQIVQLPNARLRSLNLFGCKEIAWPKIIAMDAFAHHNTITHLNLSHSILVSDTVMLYISERLVNLEQLAVSNCFALSDAAFGKIQNLRQLRELNVNNDHDVTGEVLGNLRGSALTSLRALHMAISTEHVMNYLSKMRLTRCEIGFILKATHFNDEAVKEISRTQTQLRELHVHSLSITNCALIGERHEGIDPDLEQLFMTTLHSDLVNYEWRENIELFRRMFRFESVQSPYSISNLKQLEVLNLDCCQQINDQVFKYSMDLPGLRKLSLGSTKITFAGVCYLVQKCPNLECLDLENTAINDAAVCVMVQALPKLSNLCLKNCSKLTSLSYKFIAKHCHNLKALHGWNPLCHDDMHDVNSDLTTIFNLDKMSKLYATRCILVQDDSVKLLPYANHPFYEQNLAE